MWQVRTMYRFLFVMDPYATLNMATETSLLLMRSLLQRGHQVWWTEVSDLMLQQGRVHAYAKPVQGIEPFALGAAQPLDVSTMNAVVQRKDPPFDAAYLHLTYLLDFLPPSVLQFNDASGVRNNNEKLSTLRWPQYAPPTLVTQNLSALAAFLQLHHDIVLKPVEDCSGRGLLRLRDSDADASAQLQAFLRDKHGEVRMVIAQRFIVEIAAGDKRIYLCDGDVVGLVNRIPASGKWLGNIHQGARVEACELTEREREIVAAVTPYLKAQGLFLVGMDVIGGYLTELNVTSPSAIRQINAVMGIAVHEKLVDAMLLAVTRTEPNK